MKARTKGPRAVGWWEPHWSFVPRMRWELRTLLSLRMWLRVLVLVTMITVTLAAIVQMHVPNLQFNWAMGLLGSLGLFGVQIVILATVYILIPPRITVNRRGVTVQHGNSTRSFPNSKIDAANVTLHGADRHRLWITSHGRSRGYGMPRKVDVVALQTLLGDKLAVHDNRTEEDHNERRFRIAS